jgi:TPP-dependent pyruvate/acetoin dehydrogenase alpha subunit
VGVKRSDDLGQWKRRDPVRRLVEALRDAGEMDEARYNALLSGVADEIDGAWQRAEASPFPEADATLSMVYA